MTVSNFLAKRQRVLLGKNERSPDNKTFYAGHAATSSDSPESIREQIRFAFNLKNCANFNDAFAAAACGAGNEWREINQLNSSSLLAFLCFYGVSKNNEITIHNRKYNHVLFEVKSPLPKIKGFKQPISNMDVVLLNHETKDVLFLESKFTEYMFSSKPEVSAYYSDFYKKLFNPKFNGFSYAETNDGKIKWISEKPRASMYLEGVKQMYCHYLGILNSSNIGDQPKSAHPYWNKNTISREMNLRLGTILYKFDKDVDAKGKYESYEELYAQLISRLKSECGTSSNISFEDSIITYQEIFNRDKSNQNFKLDQVVREFYCLSGRMI